MIDQSIACSKEYMEQFLFGMLIKAGINKVMRYHSDFYHDAIKIKEWNEEKNLVDQQNQDGKNIYWSVGDCGTHIDMLSSPENRSWMESYSRYDHYRIVFSEQSWGGLSAELECINDLHSLEG